MQNLAHDKRHADRLREMRSLIKHDLEAIGRPFGEFIPGGNTSFPGQINEQLALVKQIDIHGKKITVPESLARKARDTDKPDPDDRTEKKGKREVRKKAREQAKPNSQKGSDN
jgi:hypothetical protein